MGNAYQDIDLTTLQPNGKTGEPGPTAWKKAKEMFQDIYLGRTDVANRLHYMDAAGKDAFTAITQAARNLLDDADSATMLQTLGLGTPSTIGKSVLTAADAAAMRTLIGLVIGGSGNFFDKVGYVSSGGVMDIGSAIDFHGTSGDTSDFNIRLIGDSPAGLLVQRQGGVGRLMYDQNTILGTVGFVNNIPSGAMLQYIAGGDGKSFALRLADGTQIAAGVSGSLTANGAYGSGYASSVGYTGFPAAFAAAPIVLYNTQNQSGGLAMPISDTTASATSASSRIFSFIQNVTATFGYIALGRWI